MQVLFRRLAGTADLLFKFIRPDTLERLGGPAVFAKNVNAAIDTLASYLKTPERIPELLFGTS